MSKKDYQMIADVLRDKRGPWGSLAIDDIALALSVKLGDDNPRFKTDVFLAACGVDPDGTIAEIAHELEGDRKWAEIQATRAKMGLEPNPRPNR